MGNSALSLLFMDLLLFIILIIAIPTGLIISPFLLLGFPFPLATALGIITWLLLFFFGFYVAIGFKVVSEWERAPILRLGKYIGMLGPGFMHVWRGLESIVTVIDLRVNAVTARSEETMTKDNVPVNVDAIIYWKVINPEMAILNVSKYLSMISYVSQTSLREIIGEHVLDELIAEREKLGQRLKDIIDTKTEEWGVQVISVEVRDIKIPSALQDAMARQAQAEREKRARVILASAEVEASDQFLEAAKIYGQDPRAMELRWMNILYELGISGKGNLIFVPSYMPDMKFDNISGVGALGIKGLKRNNDEQ